ncbi:MAG: SpoIIE family protein phosphatase [Clostridia bacterium]|nr:SpoIIE family protein phosphatase [Clostridia bacterium]
MDNLSSLTQQSVINRSREMLYYRLVELSDVFSEMNKVFRGMISGGLVGSDAKRLLLNELKNKNCNGCPNQGKCYRVFNDETTKALNAIIDSGFKKGKVNLLDVPTLFAGKCDKLNALVSTVNDLIDQYKNYAGLVNNIDASKVLLAEQLGGVSQIMKELSLDVNKGVNFEKGKEKRIIDELLYNNIICSDALVFQDNEDILSVTLAIKKEDSKKGAIAKIVSKVCGHKMDIYDDISSTRAGWQVLTLKSAPKYDVVFGIASRTKTGSIKSGDSFSVIKIKDGKYLFAICDGMGSGETAEQTSSTALGLLENFYKAGFNKEIIISSVNKLLSLGKDDVFSALDLCVIDTRNGIGDFVKMGAPESFVKHRNTTDIIKIGALPLGIIQNAESRAKEFYFASGDKIVLCSDGITDGFKNIADLQDYINNLTSTSPQAIADQILQKVLNQNKNIARDDMTIIVAKIFER